MTPSIQLPQRIYLLRHAKSGWAEPGARDFDRSLSDAGFAEAAGQRGVCGIRALVATAA